MEFVLSVVESITNFVSSSAINFIFLSICAIAFVVVGFVLSSFFVKLLKNNKLFKKLDPTVSKFLLSFISILLKFLVIVTAATIVGINVTAFSTVLATGGITIGLALQGSLTNLTGGIMILIFRPFKIGDYIDNHTDSGTVKEIGIFYTTLTTPDNKSITIPNGLLSNATVVNYSTNDTRRVDLEFPVAYGSDADKVIKVMLTVATANEKILAEPEPFAALIRQDDRALYFVLRAWCNSEDYWNVYFSLTENMKKAFDAMEIKVPLRKLDINVENKNG